ncbi:Carnosine N-methyltransferase [Dirofilaria immitis]
MDEVEELKESKIDETARSNVEIHDNMDEQESLSAPQNKHDEIIATEKVLNAMLFYRRYGITRIHMSISSFQKLSEEQQAALSPAYQYHLVKMKECIIHNQKVLKEIIECGINMFGDDFALRAAAQMTQLRPSSDHYMSKVRSTLKQIMRDWSNEGEAERESCYSDTIQILCERFPNKETRSVVEVLIPGAGLGRLVWELVTEGFSVQGNEFSILMLLTSNFILNKCKQANEYMIYPFVLDTCNNWSYEDQLRPVRFPDVCPVMPDDRPNKFSMCAGDFLEAMKNDTERWDVILTIFFIDTAVNVLDYIDTIHKLLKKGGLWINFGPLTFHFADGEIEGAIELPYDSIIQYIMKKDFRFERDVRGDKSNPALYACNQKSMLRYQYNCGFFVSINTFNTKRVVEFLGSGLSMNTIYCISELPYKESNATVLDNDFTEKYMCIGSPGLVSVVESEKYSAIPRNIKTNRNDAHIIRWQRLNDISGSHIICASTQFFDIYIVNSGCLNLLGSTCAHPFNLADVDWCLYDSNVLLSCSIDDAVKCWDLRDLRCPCLQMHLIGGAEQAKWAPLSTNLLCTSHCTDLRLWDKRNVNLPLQTVSAHVQKISCIMWHPTNATCFLTAGLDGYIKMWDSSNLTKPRHSLGMLSTPIWKIKFSSDGNEFASIPLPPYGQVEESCALSLWKTSTLEIVQVIECENDVLLDLCWQRFRMQRQTYSCLYSASRYGKLRKYNLPLFADLPVKIMEKNCPSRVGESTEDAFVLDEELKESTKTQAPLPNTNALNATFDDISKQNKRQSMMPKIEIIENKLCLTVSRQIDILIAELVLLKRMCNDDLTVDQLDDKHSLITWSKNATLKSRIKVALSLEKRLEEFTYVIIQITSQESYLSTDEIKIIFKKLSDKTINIDASLEKEPILPVILHDLLKIIASMELFVSRSLDIPQRPENVVQFCESASSENDSHGVKLESISTFPLKSALSSPLISTSYDRWIPSPRTCGARFNGSGFLIIFGRNELATRRTQSSKSSFQDESLWLSVERITQTLKSTSLRKGLFNVLDDGQEVISSTPRSFDEYKHELLSAEDMHTHIHNFCGHEKCSLPLCRSISSTPFFPRNMASFHQKFDITSSGTSPLLGMRASNSLAMLNSIYSSAQNVRSFRRRGNSGTNVLADDHHHLDSSAPISVVVIYDVSVLMSFSKDLARKYRLIGGNALELCLWNRKVVKEVGLKDLENIWQIVELCIRLAKSSRRKRYPFDLNKTLTSMLDSDSLEDDSMVIALHPFGRSLINSLLDYFARINDYQTAAVIICVLGFRNNRFFDSTAESSTTAKCAIYHEHSINNCDTNPDDSIHRTIHTNIKLGLNLRLSQEKGKLYMSEQSSLTASASKTARKFSSLFQNAFIGYRPVQTVKIEQVNMTSCSHHIPNMSMISNAVEHPQQDPAQDIKKNKPNLNSLLDPLYNDRFDEIRHQYASLLFRWRMFSKVAEVMKYSENAPYSAPLRIQSSCPHCYNKSLLFKCDKCAIPWKFRCSLCQLPVLGMLTICALCGHGGHSEHMVIWFKENNRCAYGCGCNSDFDTVFLYNSTSRMIQSNLP